MFSVIQRTCDGFNGNDCGFPIQFMGVVVKNHSFHLLSVSESLRCGLAESRAISGRRSSKGPFTDAASRRSFLQT